MRRAFAHEAVLVMATDGDLRAPGGAVTVALCGSWGHQPPCSVPHHTSVERAGDRVRVRVLFAPEPEREAATRDVVERALSSGSLQGPDGLRTRWQLEAGGPSAVTAEESEHAERLAN